MRNSILKVIKQHADLTFKHNVNHDRHGWLRLTPAYSVKLVDSIIREKDKTLYVFDPFSGTATTALCAAYLGHRAASSDINPFLVWLGNAKLRRYSQSVLRETKEQAGEIQSAIDRGKATACPPPPIAHIERWWDQKHLEYLCSVKGEIEKRLYRHQEVKDLLLMAFCRSMIDLSNAAFNHQSMSFKNSDNCDNQPQLWPDGTIENKPFASYVDAFVHSASHNPSGDGRVLRADARILNEIPEVEFDIIITSPPYPNRMSYIRELRPYMYWLGYLKEAREAGELDWQAIGGTWGIATSRLQEWRCNASTFFPDYLEDIIRNIASSDGKSGKLLSNYVGKYFEDMWHHFLSVRSLIKQGGELHYIIGNSKFYHCLVPSEKIYADMLKKAGFQNIEIQVIRKRNSKKELFEFDVVATK